MIRYNFSHSASIFVLRALRCSIIITMQLQIMKESKGKANPALLNKILLEKLNSKP